MSTVLALPAKLNTAAAPQLVVDLKKIDGNLTLDATQTKFVGALCLQALVAASRSAKSSGTSFEITGLSQAVEQQMAVMGVTPQRLMESTL